MSKAIIVLLAIILIVAFLAFFPSVKRVAVDAEDLSIQDQLATRGALPAQEARPEVTQTTEPKRLESSEDPGDRGPEFQQEIEIAVIDENGKPVQGAEIESVIYLKRWGIDKSIAWGNLTAQSGNVSVPASFVIPSMQDIREEFEPGSIRVLLSGIEVGRKPMPAKLPESGRLEFIIEAPGWLDVDLLTPVPLGEGDLIYVRIWQEDPVSQKLEKAVHKFAALSEIRVPVIGGIPLEVSAKWVSGRRIGYSGPRLGLPAIALGDERAVAMEIQLDKKIILPFKLPTGSSHSSLEKVSVWILDKEGKKAQPLPDFYKPIHRNLEISLSLTTRIVGETLFLEARGGGVLGRVYKGKCWIPDDIRFENELLRLPEVELEPKVGTLLCEGTFNLPPEGMKFPPILHVEVDGVRQEGECWLELDPGFRGFKVFAESDEIEPWESKSLAMWFNVREFLPTRRYEFKAGTRDLTVELVKGVPLHFDVHNPSEHVFSPDELSIEVRGEGGFKVSVPCHVGPQLLKSVSRRITGATLHYRKARWTLDSIDLGNELVTKDTRVQLAAPKTLRAVEVKFVMKDGSKYNGNRLILSRERPVSRTTIYLSRLGSTTLLIWDGLEGPFTFGRVSDVGELTETTVTLEEMLDPTGVELN